MRIPTPIQALSAAAALALLAGCSGGSAIAPKMGTPQGHVSNNMGHVPAVVSSIGASKINIVKNNHKGFYACPATGQIEYISDFNSSTIYIFSGDFAGQSPCGMITAGLANPQGLFIKKHDLYVANTGGTNVLVFHRGATTAYNTYNDGLANYAVDVTVTKDKYLIATNIFNSVGGSGTGSISTWKIGPNGGTFLHNYPTKTGNNDYFLTVQEKTSTDTVYFDDSSTHVYKVNCPAGTCGTISDTGVVTSFPGGIRSADETAEKEDLVVDDQNGATLTTYETFPSGTSCSDGAGDGVSFDLNKPNTKAFIADNGSSSGRETKYPACGTLIGTVNDPGGLPIGAAVDPAASIR